MLPQLNQVVLKPNGNCWVCPLALSPVTADSKEPTVTTDVTNVYEEKSVFMKNIQTLDPKDKGGKRKRSKADALLATLDVCVLIMLHHM